MLERVWRKGNPLTLLVGMQTSTATMENLKKLWRFLKKLEIKLPYDPAIPLLSIHTVGFQCMKVKSESEVAQSCPTLCDSMDCSPPGSSVHGIF